jgi:hypothetical protein
MDPNWYGGKWMCFARLNKNQDFNGVNIFSRTVVGDPSDLGSSFTVPIGIMAPDNIGYDLEVMVTVHGGGGSGSAGPWRSDFGGRLGGIWKGVNLEEAFDEVYGDATPAAPAKSGLAVSHDGVNYTAIGSVLNKSGGWTFTISANSGTGAYNDSNVRTSGFILHGDTVEGDVGKLYGKVYWPEDGGDSSGTSLGGYTDFDYVHVWIRAPE